MGQARLAPEAGFANNTKANGYIEILNDLACISPSYPINSNDFSLTLRKACKFQFINTQVAIAYHPYMLRSVKDFRKLTAHIRSYNERLFN